MKEHLVINSYSPHTDIVCLKISSSALSCCERYLSREFNLSKNEAEYYMQKIKRMRLGEKIVILDNDKKEQIGEISFEDRDEPEIYEDDKGETDYGYFKRKRSAMTVEEF